jgi:CHAT domain-containing protein
MAACCLGAAGFALGGCGAVTPRGIAHKGQSPFSELVAAAAGLRFVEPRLTGGFSHAPCQPAPAAPTRLSEPLCWQLPGKDDERVRGLSRAVSRIHAVAFRHPDLESKRADAVVELLLGRHDERLDHAVAALEEAADTTGDARAANDVAAAYVVRAQRRNEPEDLARALDTADRALAGAPALAEARFNRALALQLLFLDGEASAAWQNFLRADARSGWALEARSRLRSRTPAASPWEESRDTLCRAATGISEADMERRIGRFHQEARELVEQDLLPGWGEELTAGDGEAAARTLRCAHAVAGALAALRGETLAREAVAAIEVALSARDRGHIAALARGHRAFGAGYIAYKLYQVDRASRWLTIARRELRRGGSPLAFRAAFFLACNDYNRNRPLQADLALRHLAADADCVRYPSLAAHVAWVQGLIQVVFGRPLAALAFYESSLERFAAVGEIANVASLRSLLAEGFDHIGRHREAWQQRYQALSDARVLRDPQLLFLTFGTMADAALAQGWKHLALHFQNELIRRVEGSGNPVLLADAYSWRGLMHEMLGDGRQAAADLGTALRYVERQSDPSILARTSADLALIEGSLMTARDPALAVARLSSALAVYRRAHHYLLSTLAYRARAHAYRSAGDLERAEADLRAGIAAYERASRTAAGDEAAHGLLQRSSSTFDEMIAFQVDALWRSERALAYADRKQTRILPELSRFEPAADLKGIRRRLPAGTSVVEYAVLADRIFIWRLERGGVHFFVRPCNASRLTELVSRQREARQRQEALYDLLVRPWRRQVGAGERLVFVPDKALRGVAFSCLRDPRTGRYLVEDHPTAVALSATLYAGSQQAGQPLPPPRRLLAVAGDAFDRRLFPQLSPLPAAAAEASRIADLYPEHRLLQGPAADRRRLLALVRSSEVFHFAGHAVVEPRQPQLSFLVLAPGAGGEDRGALYAREIERLRLPGTRLVVLASCDSAAANVLDGEGVSSLGRVFLAAGVQTVVASLWRVDDRAAAAFFESFHKHILEGREPTEALRSAQLELLRGGDIDARSPAVWGGFEVIAARAH